MKPLIVLAMLALVVGCGRKGDPIPPGAAEPDLPAPAVSEPEPTPSPAPGT